MKKILLTGSSGFVGRNILPILREEYEVLAPSRQELDLKDQLAVKEYIKEGDFDAVIHSANPNPVKNAQCDESNRMFEDSMRIFMNFYNASSLCKKIIYLGSGAEYDKSMDIVDIKESEIGRSIPLDVYGCTKYIMNELASKKSNMYNLRLFACFGPYDHESKFITHVIRCCLRNEDITIRQNCYFDYLHVFDLAKVIIFFIENNLKYHDYNIASGRKTSLLEIAEEVKRQMGVDNEIVIKEEGWNNEYTANIDRLNAESGIKNSFIPFQEGIRMQIDFERRNWK
ncbi:MAG: NAD(P)-dependent oxidoreductase [Lachnospiraceae bacterium]|nr:NAD(P)-dependent oxidoreductase [Lachnospiraceae bacterium]